MSKRHYVLNGKFLRASPTGVHRVAAELSAALAMLITEDHEAARGLSLTGVTPFDGLSRAKDLPFAVAPLGPLTGVPWEQITLPLHRRHGTLLNLCNLGPMLSRDAVTMIHDVQVLLSPQSYDPAFRLWYRTLQPVIARRHRHLLTVSEFSRGQIVSAGLCDASKVSVIHNGCDHILREIADPACFNRLGLARDGYVVALANTQLHKNIGVLLRAFANPALAGAKLVLFGGGDRSAFEQAGHAIPANVLFAGRISDGELRHLLEHALCLAFPSQTEGFGLPPLEAMALGCPAIVAPCGALPEVCGKAALYAEPGDPAEWAAKMSDLAGSSVFRKQLAENGRVHAARFTWRQSAIALAAVLSHI